MKDMEEELFLPTDPEGELWPYSYLEIFLALPQYQYDSCGPLMDTGDARSRSRSMVVLPLKRRK
jgi:hypothetical protein